MVHDLKMPLLWVMKDSCFVSPQQQVGMQVKKKTL